MQYNAKKIHALVAVVAFGTFTANAQNENSGKLNEAEVIQLVLDDTTRVETIQADKLTYTIATEDTFIGYNRNGEPVIAHPTDTIFVTGTSYFFRNGEVLKAPAKVVKPVDEIVTIETRNDEQWEKLKHASVESRFAEEMAASSGRKRDTQWYQAVSGNDTLNIVKHGNDKNYWFIAGGGKFQVSDGCNGLGGFLQVQYWSDSFWFGAVSADITRNEMYAKAEDAGAWYTSYSGSAFGGLKHDFGRRENITLALYGGFRATWQKTNTREFQDEYGNTYMMKSTHSTYSPLVGAMAKYRFPDTRFAIFGGAEWSQKNLTNQNASDYERHSAWDFFLGISIGLHGNYVRTK